MCEPSGICCGRTPFAVINQPPNYLINQNQLKARPCFSAASTSQTCGFGMTNCIPTCCPHPALCVERRPPEPLMTFYCPCACPIRCRCAGECCPRNYCSPPFMPPFV